MSNIANLVFNKQIVGYRAVSNNKKYDVEVGVPESLGISMAGISKSITLVDHNGLLMSKSEIDTGNKAIDITDNQVLIRQIFRVQETPKAPPKPKAPPTPKIKGKKDLQYKNGLAIILTGLEEENAEYETLSTTYEVYLVFKTKKAITEASAILGYSLDKKRTLEAFERGTKAFRVRLSGNSYWELTHKFDAPEGGTKEGFSFSSANHYSDWHYSVQLVPPTFEYDKTGKLEYAQTGTTADGDSLEDYVKYVQNSFEKGHKVFYPTLSLRDITRM